MNNRMCNRDRSSDERTLLGVLPLKVRPKDDTRNKKRLWSEERMTMTVKSQHHFIVWVYLEGKRLGEKP